VNHPEQIGLIAPLRARLVEWRSRGRRIALVPTMGNLHPGHISLVSEARRRADRVVVSIFVNPTQFVVGEDYADYPRTLDQDSRLLADAQADLLFVPSVEVLYPPGGGATRIAVGALGDELCGASRPGHFSGVATVVTKLFNIVQPDLALFGEKDFQQLLVIRQLVRDLDFGVEIVGCPTDREADGLARSSRNGYLDREQRLQAPLLYQTLNGVAERLVAGESDYLALERWAVGQLSAAGWQPDYCAIRCSSDLSPVSAGERSLVVLAAARLGRARLIDNLRVELK
jgi:pantoate--beta-alanine ligase